MNDSSSYELLALNSTRSSRQDAYITKFSEPSDAGRITSSSDLFVGLYCYEYNYDIRMHKRPAFDCTRGQYFPDFWDFSPGCPLLGALLSRRASSRSPDRTPAGGGRVRARVTSWGRAQSSKRSPYPLDGTALISLHYPCQKCTVPLSREYPICTSLILRLHAILLLPFNPPCSRTPNLNTAVSSANRAALLMPDRPSFFAKSCPCTAAAVVVDPAVHNKHAYAKKKSTTPPPKIIINNNAHHVQTKFPVLTTTR